MDETQKAVLLLAFRSTAHAGVLDSHTQSLKAILSVMDKMTDVMVEMSEKIKTLEAQINKSEPFGSGMF